MSDDDLTTIPDRRAAHWRLKPETWAIVMAEYQGGATAPELAAKWRVSIHAIRKKITQTGAAKRDHGDAQAQAQAQARDWDASREAARTAFRRRVEGLFVTSGHAAEDTDMPGRLSRQAVQAAGRAMRAGLWEEARALLGFGETFQKVAVLERDPQADELKRMPLTAILAARFASKETLEPLLNLSNRPGVADPDRELKEYYWRTLSNEEQLEAARQKLLDEQADHIAALKAKIGEMGGTEPAFAYSAVKFDFSLAGRRRRSER